MAALAPFVVAVSGTSGAGKSTLVQGLAATFTGTGRPVVCLHFDHYAPSFPEDVASWVRRGADPNEWRTERLVDALVARRGETSEPRTLILLEEPFGRARTAMQPLVDLAVHIDLPLGDSLARRLLRDFVPEAGETTRRDLDRLRTYLHQYVDGGGAAYEAIDDLARQSSDVVLDGRCDRDELAERARSEVESRLAW